MKFFLIILFILSSFKTFAQKAVLNDQQIASHVSTCLNNNYHPDPIVLQHTCRRACIFIKFNVNKQGRIANLTFSKDPTLFITEALKKALKLLQNDARLMRTLRLSGKTVIQPIIYFYQAGCDFPKNYPMPETAEEGTKNLLTYYKKLADMEHYGDTISDMMNFGGGKLTAIDCILLAPVWFGDGAIE